MSARLKAMPAARRMPVRTRRVDLDGEWAGWWYEARVNAPAGTLLRLQDLREDEGAALENLAHLVAFLAAIATAWNFVDEAGADLPVGHAGCEKLPPELVYACIGAFNRLVVPPKA